MVKYESTRGSKNYKTAAQAVIQGIAEDEIVCSTEHTGSSNGN